MRIAVHLAVIEDAPSWGVIVYCPPAACNSTATSRTSLLKLPVERE
jgi:hypothetical protein